jgi:hypothetical protein
MEKKTRTCSNIGIRQWAPQPRQTNHPVCFNYKGVLRFTSVICRDRIYVIFSIHCNIKFEMRMDPTHEMLSISLTLTESKILAYIWMAMKLWDSARVLWKLLCNLFRQAKGALAWSNRKASTVRRRETEWPTGICAVSRVLTYGPSARTAAYRVEVSQRVGQRCPLQVCG